MMSRSTGRPPGNHPRIQPPLAGLLPVQRDATVVASRHIPHDNPAPGFSEREPLHPSALIARYRRSRRGRPRRPVLDRGQPADQPGVGWDLCDDIVQQLFAVGIAMQTTQRRCTDHPEVAARIAEHMNDLQQIIEQLRSTTPEPTSLPAKSRLN